MAKDELFSDEATPEEETTIAEISETEEAKGFDLAEWLSGVRVARKSVILYARPDLMAEIDHCSELEIKTRGAQSDGYRSRAIELTEQLVQSGMEFVVEARSTAWQTQFHKSLDKRGIKDPTVRSFHQLAAQVVQPAGLDADDVAMLEEASPGQVAKLATAMIEVNNNAPIINPRFSQPS